MDKRGLHNKIMKKIKKKWDKAERRPNSMEKKC